MRQARCTTPSCEHYGVLRDVPDMPVAEGVVHRVTPFCAGCDGLMAEGRSSHADRETAVRTPPETR